MFNKTKIPVKRNDIESALQKTCVAYCNWLNVFVVHHANQRLANIQTHVWLKHMGVVKGMPDLEIAHPKPNGGILYVECKAPGEKLKKRQAEVLEKLRLLGHEVGVVENFEEFRKILHFHLNNCGWKKTPNLSGLEMRDRALDKAKEKIS